MALGDALQENKVLKRLNVANNSIDSVACLTICAGVLENEVRATTIFVIQIHHIVYYISVLYTIHTNTTILYYTGAGACGVRREPHRRAGRQDTHGTVVVL